MKTIFIVTIFFKNGDRTRYAVQTYEHALKCAIENSKFTHVHHVEFEKSVLYLK